jgi:demethylmenaquinone methyltransferase/2-methoxy-6-polyprenyl-1,4-benzoquinol methylase
VPPERFTQFWRLVRACLAPGGRVFFIDSRREPTSTAIDHRLPADGNPVMRRLLNDGREFEVYKIFYEPTELTERLNKLGWRFDIRQTERFFVYGAGNLQSAGVEAEL